MRLRHWTLFGAILLLTGCSRSEPQNTVKGEQGETLAVALPEIISVVQGDEQKFSLTVTRKDIDADVHVEFGKLPDGLSIAEKETTFPKGTNQRFFTLKATKEAPPQKEARITATGSATDLKATATMRVQVKESLETKAAQQKEFTKEVKDRLDTVKADLETAQERIKKLDDAEQRSDYLKRASKVVDSLGEAENVFRKMEASPAETWHQQKAEVQSTVASVENSAQKFLAQVNTAVDSKSK